MNYSPLRYPGGKTSLYDFLKKALKVNNIVDGVYVEAFAGGAGAALKLLMLENVYQIYLNDKDEMIYKFWYSILNHTDEFIQLIRNCELSCEEWEYRKEVLKSKELRSQLTDLEVGFSTFYLNRCNRSGILKAGMIGGNKQQGKWKLDARFNKEDLIKKIEKIARYKERIKIYNLDAISFIKKVEKEFLGRKDVLFYLDPPYVEQGQGLYNVFFTENDHKKLAQFLQKETKLKWLVSYDDHPLVHSIYKEVSKNIFEFNYFANRTKVGRELVICSKKSKMPTTYLHYSKSKLIQEVYTEDVAI
ncbi:DNA adenine methylase [Myroides odoratimimus]|uniref:DNA adenine methylase n=1 Tax=Myroides odoratimimus TaxID=76832 RepID=UPI00257584ED|nr:DNA adenine methylase [Myroides odoratimimus]MDM1506452.1 DNA adenine methylase [Myroides odoratimimus]